MTLLSLYVFVIDAQVFYRALEFETVKPIDLPLSLMSGELATAESALVKTEELNVSRRSQLYP